MTNKKSVQKKKRIIRYLKYLAVGFPSFSLELLMLRIFLYNFHLPVFLAAGTAFVIAETISHITARKFVFPETTRSSHVSYMLYLCIASVSLLMVSLLMHIFVDIHHLNPFLSRIGIGFFTGVWSFLMNFYVNFKVAHH